MKTLREIGDQLRANNNYVLVSHSIPDGDSIGSLIGLFWALKSINKEVCIIIEDNPPPIYSYLNGVDLIKTAEGLDPQWRKVIFLDCSDAGRVGDKTRLFLKDREYFINIDHHTTNELFAQYNYVDPKAAATAQIVYELLEEMKIAITPNIADPLFAGLVMDTGSFLK
jgi:phosphoesterase RecJ-like protein